MKRHRIPISPLLMTVAISGALPAQSREPQTPTDWDLYSLRLVNRARTSPEAENLIQGTGFMETAVPPLAYSTLLGRVARNHTHWMSANRDNPAINNSQNSPIVPDSFAHYETLSGLADGPTGKDDTIGWTGDRLVQRFDYVDLDWIAGGENIFWRRVITNIDSSHVELNHAGWWKSDVHRDAMMNRIYNAFGHYAVNDPIGRNRGNWSTQNFARTPTENSLFGLLYDDVNEDGKWTPRDRVDLDREGLAGVVVEVRSPDGDIVTATETLDNGSYSVNVGHGTYDILFRGDVLRDGEHILSGISMAGVNVDMGDTLVSRMELPAALLAGDANQDLAYNQFDIIRVLVAGKYRTGEPATWGDGDWDGAPGGSQGAPPPGDGLFDQFDVLASQIPAHYNSGPYAADTAAREQTHSGVRVLYDVETGEVSLEVSSGHELNSLLIESSSGILGQGSANQLNGAFDVDEVHTLFKSTLGGSFGSLSFGSVAPAGLDKQMLLDDLTVTGTLARGGQLGAVDIVHLVPEPCAVILVLGGLITSCLRRRVFHS